MPKFGLILIISSIVILLCSTLFEYCESLRFDMQSRSTKCISEDIKRDGMTVSKYSVINPNPYPNFNIDLKPNPSGNFYPIPSSHRITARLCSPPSLYTSFRFIIGFFDFGGSNNYHYGDKVESGKFAFTVAKTRDCMACFCTPYHNPPLKIGVEFEWRTRVDAKDCYGELRRLHDTVNSIHNEVFFPLCERKEEMQALNRATNSKMAFFSFFSIILCLSVATVQLWHLKGYFERKKLL
ncbi:hypothetical protein Cgig2_023071 [Carnegiea gigantea]|uniref:GOLD domain-containing protein n=1 Tax=Carnegiea gigantea TaxID=171969 RepID=A0A9Q1JYC9_9CARY|nr:hypothetical protein Cgig2_023071 [Carnegiea gigantea]